MRCPPGVDPLELAIEYATQSPVKVQGPNSPWYTKIIAIAYHLQTINGNRDIYLPQQRIAKALRVSQPIISAYLSVAVQKGLLSVVSGYSRDMKIAKHYRFNLDRFSADREEIAAAYTRVVGSEGLKVEKVEKVIGTSLKAPCVCSLASLSEEKAKPEDILHSIPSLKAEEPSWEERRQATKRQLAQMDLPQ